MNLNKTLYYDGFSIHLGTNNAGSPHMTVSTTDSDGYKQGPPKFSKTFDYNYHIDLLIFLKEKIGDEVANEVIDVIQARNSALATVYQLDIVQGDTILVVSCGDDKTNQEYKYIYQDKDGYPTNISEELALIRGDNLSLVVRHGLNRVSLTNDISPYESVRKLSESFFGNRSTLKTKII